MTATDRPPTMAQAMPEVTERLVDLLRDLGHHDLAAALPAQRFHGRCHCRPECRFALTAPQGASGSLMVWLEIVEDEPIGQASLHPHGYIVTSFEIDEPQALGLPPDWLERAIQPTPTTQPQAQPGTKIV
jgi:hypothetical protein